MGSGPSLHSRLGTPVPFVIQGRPRSSQTFPRTPGPASMSIPAPVAVPVVRAPIMWPIAVPGAAVIMMSSFITGN